MNGRDRLTIRQAGEPRESFGPYWYEIYRDDNLVARIWHDYRGSESGVVFLHEPRRGQRPAKWPFIAVTEFLSGGGTDPISLTEDAMHYFLQELAA